MKGLPWWLRRYRILLQCGRPGFDPGVGKIPWRRAWQPTPVFLPGDSHAQRSLAGCSPWGCKESDTTEGLSPAEKMNVHFKSEHLIFLPLSPLSPPLPSLFSLTTVRICFIALSFSLFCREWAQTLSQLQSWVNIVKEREKKKNTCT